jgi:hypothetical protein
MRAETEIVPVRKALLFEPHFRPKAISDALLRVMTAQEKRKWTIYFEQWGCLACGHTQKRIHAGNGFCTKCHCNVAARLRTIVRNLSRGRESVPAELHEISAAVSEAERLLGPVPRRKLRPVFQKPIETGTPALRERVNE